MKKLYKNKSSKTKLADLHRVFPMEGWGGDRVESPSPITKHLLIPSPTWKNSPNKLPHPHQIFIPTHQRLIFPVK